METISSDSELLAPPAATPTDAEEYVARQQARSALAALRESERRARAVLDGTTGFLVLLTQDGLILDMNRTALASLFAARETVIGESFAELAWFRGVPGSAATLDAGLKTAASGTAQNCELAINDPERGRRIVDFIFNPVTDADPGGGFVVVDGRDVTERRAAEERNRALEVQLMNAHKMESLGTLAGGVAHEINTPIQYVGDNIKFLDQAFAAFSAVHTAGLALLRTLESGADYKPALAHIRSIITETDLDFLLREIPAAVRQSEEGIGQVRQIVSAVKEFSHPDRKDIAPEDLASAIRTTVTVSRNQWKYVADVECDLDPALPPVPCQLGKINQVMLNLIVNAAQAIEAAHRKAPGTIHIGTRKDGAHAEIRVHDNGAGIKPEHRARIFDMFFTTKSPGHGTGQGLAICQSIVVREHGGTLTFESEEGEGTTFILRLPLERRAAPR